MSIFERKPALRWVAPLAFVAVVAGTTGIVATATADNKLPEISAQDLLVNVQQAKVDNLSGTVVQTADLGIPALPGFGGSDDASLTSLISGTHTLGVWKSGADKARLQVQGTNDESDIVVNGKDMWTWSYKDNTATHRTLPDWSTNADAGDHSDLPGDLPKTPEEAAKRALDAIGPTTDVRTDGTAEVAGIDAYELVLTPKDDESLIAQVRIAVDGTRYLPLRVQVIAGENEPTTVFEVAYSNLSFDRPEDSQFTFNPPPGAKVTEVAPKEHSSKAPSKKERKALKEQRADQAEDTDVVGEGWTSVVVSDMGGEGADAATGQAAQILNALPKVSGDWGSGRLLSGTAFSAVLTDDGRVAVGAVTPDRLYDALAK